MPRVAYFVHGRGKGHAVRTRGVLEQLEGRAELRLYCAGSSHDLLRDHPASARVLPYAPGRGMLRSFRLRLRMDRRRLRDWRPDIVVSDGDGPSVHAAWSLGVPVLAIGHGLIFRHTRLDAELPTLERVREIINAGSSSWPASRRVAVHFAPVEARTPGTVVARPDLRVSVELDRPRDDFILAYFRDDNGAAALEQLASRGHRVVLFGRPDAAPPGVEVYAPDVRAFANALAHCQAVVGSAGNQLPAECAMLGVPMLALHDERDPEQTMNAHLIEHAGIGLGAAFERLDRAVLQRFERELDHDRTTLAERTRAMPPASQVIPALLQGDTHPPQNLNGFHTLQTPIHKHAFSHDSPQAARPVGAAERLTQVAADRRFRQELR